MNDATRELLKGKVLCGNANGDKILITAIDFVSRTIEEQEVFVLQLSGEAKAYLNNPLNPDAGATVLAEPIPVTLEQNTEKDAVIQLKVLSSALGLSEEDRIDGSSADWLSRFDEAAPDSVVPALKNKGLYFKTTEKKNWEKAVRYGESPFYFNAFAVPTREAATSSKIAAVRARLLAKSSGTVLDGVV